MTIETLSDKGLDLTDMQFGETVYCIKDVKEFIKELKEELKGCYTPSLFGELLLKINKLAGEKLI